MADARLAVLAGLLMTIPAHSFAATTPARVAEAPPGQANLYRDRWGMAHIYAQREEDGFFGLGYAAGENHLEGILLAYLSVRGELASAFGPGPLNLGRSVAVTPVIADTVDADITALRGRYLEEARANLPKLSAQTRANLTAYVAGLQRYIDDHPQRRPAWAPPLEPALPAAYYAMLFNGEGQRACAGKLPAPAVPAMRGSNAWALAPARTVESATIFGADSHSEIEVFGTFFQSWRMKAGKLDVFAADISGMAVILKGHSPAYGWAWTEGPRFIADCYEVRTDRADPRAFLFDGRLQHMETRPYEIRVKGAAAVRGVFDYTRHNGVLSPVVARDGDRAYVSSSAYAGRAGFAHDQMRALALARGGAALDKALSGQDLYPANLLIGGADGSIRFIRPGRIPIRPPAWKPDAPLDGSTSAAAWRGLTPYAAKLKLVSPPEGYLTNENISPDMMFAGPKLNPADYPAWFAFQPGYTSTRQRRAIELLAPPRRIAFDDARAIIFDDLVLGADRWAPALSSALAANAWPAPPSAAARALVESAAGFDGHFAPESHAALAHAELRDALATAWPPQANEIGDSIKQGRPLDRTQQSLLLAAGAQAADRLTRAFGRVDLAFGDVYVTGRGGVTAPGLGRSFSGGGASASLTANVYDPPGADGRRRHISGMRMPFLVQFTKPLKSFSLSFYGASDDPASTHYSDQAPLLGQRRLKPNYFDAADLAANLESARTLNTAPDGTRP